MEEKINLKREILLWIAYLAVAFIIAFSLRFFVFELVQVDGVSMEPSLSSNEALFVEKITKHFEIKRGQIIIVRYPDRDGAYVKRAMGLPGDKVKIEEGYLYINGEKMEEPYIKSSPMMHDMKEITVPEDCYFVMGDNRNDSLDSRNSSVGPIPKSEVIGHALFIIWPPGQIGGLDS